MAQGEEHILSQIGKTSTPSMKEEGRESSLLNLTSLSDRAVPLLSA